MRPALLALAAISVALAGPVRAEPAVPAEVKLSATGAGWIFTDQGGMVLYTYDRDTAGKSACYAACAKAWPPLEIVDDRAPGLPEWSIIDRDGGGKQWAYKGRPLYRFAEDAYPGATFGDDPGGAWHLAFEPVWMPAEVTLAKTLIGTVLADVDGLTLYGNAADKVQPDTTVTSACGGDCLQTWRPVSAPWAAVASGDWSIVARADRTKQWAYRGRPLYAHANDMAPGETRGHEVSSQWQAMVVEPPPKFPAWVTFQASDAGELLADNKGQTIYAFNEAQNQARRSNLSAPATCDSECIRTFWIPLTANAEEQPIGNWSTVKNGDGKYQWAYKGELIFTHTRDSVPGDITGTRFTGSRAWHPIMRSDQPMQGMGGN